MSLSDDENGLADVTENIEHKKEILRMIKEHRSILFTLRQRNQTQKQRIWTLILSRAQEFRMFSETAQKVDCKSMSNKWYGWKNSAQKRFRDAMKSGGTLEREDFGMIDQIILFDVLDMKLPGNSDSREASGSDAGPLSPEVPKDMDEVLNDFSEIEEDIINDTVACLDKTYTGVTDLEVSKLPNTASTSMISRNSQNYNRLDSVSHKEQVSRMDDPKPSKKIEYSEKPLEKEIWRTENHTFLHSAMFQEQFPAKYREAFLENKHKRQKLQLRILEQQKDILTEELIRMRGKNSYAETSPLH